MEKNRANRPQSMNEVVDALNEIINSSQVEDSSEMTMQINPTNNDFDFDSPPAQKAKDFHLDNTDELIADSEKFMGQNRPIAAYNCLKKALEIQPENTRIREKLEKAKEESTVASIKIGEDLLEHGRITEIRAELHQKIKENPDDTTAMEKLQALDFMDQQKRAMTQDVRKYLGREKYEEAIRLWDKIPKTMREKSLSETMDRIKNIVLPVQQLITEIEKLNGEGKIFEAEKKIKEAEVLDSNNDIIHKYRQLMTKKLQQIERLLKDGAESEINGKYDDAISYYSKILALIPAHQQATKKRLECLKVMAGRVIEGGNIADAESIFTELITVDPKNIEARTQLEKIKKHNLELKTHLTKGTTALSQKKYLSAMHSCKKALKLNPNQKSARFRLREAKKCLLLKRIIPMGIIVIAILAATIAGSRIWFDNLLDKSNTEIANNNFKQAKESLELAKKTPFWSWKKHNELVDGFNKIKLRTIYKKINDSYQKAIRNNEQSYRNNFISTANDTIKSMRSMSINKNEKKSLHADILYKKADLFYKTKEFIKASNLYHEYLTFTEKEKITSKSIAKKRSLGLDAWKKGIEFIKQNKNESALFYLQTAVQNIPNFKDAKEKIETITIEKAKFSSLVDTTREMMEKIRRTDDFKDAKKLMMKTKTNIEKIIALENDNPEAKRFSKEISWRLDAGPNMVLFMLGGNKAFAIDRYEYPNIKGKTPITASFFEARRLAREAGKTLPDIDLWQRATRGINKKLTPYPWGMTFKRNKCVSSVYRETNEPSASGSFDGSTIGLKVYDLSGNLAEWIDSGENQYSEEASAIGGNFSDNDPAELTVNSIKTYPTKINNGLVGFRCVKLYGKAKH